MNNYHTYADFCKTFYLVSGVYCIHNRTTDKRYIGESENVAARIHGHFLSLKYKNHPNKPLQKDFDSYGENDFEITLLCEATEYKQRLDKEQEITKDLISRHIPLYSSFLHNASAKPLVTEEQITEICDLRAAGHKWEEIKNAINKKYNISYSVGWYKGKFDTRKKTGLAPKSWTLRNNLKLASQP